MLANTIAVLLIVSGAFFLFFPGALRWSLKRKTKRRIRRYFFALALSIGILLISEGWRHEGWLPKILVLIGIVALQRQRAEADVLVNIRNLSHGELECAGFVLAAPQMVEIQAVGAGQSHGHASDECCEAEFGCKALRSDVPVGRIADAVLRLHDQ